MSDAGRSSVSGRGALTVPGHFNVMPTLVAQMTVLLFSHLSSVK